ncbi:MAG: DUF721 domain-containing protein [Bacteroidetes bacterium]|nr:DUF721 domain-containing protein [Bacteroidota bacterium]
MKRIWQTRQLGSVLRRVLREEGLERGIREQHVLQKWEEIVGPAIAANAEPLRLRNGVLWLHVVDAAWRQELSLMRQELVTTINTTLGENIVTDIRLR